jgi:hypothetical protein
MDAIGFEYPDYERLDKGAEGQKRKRVASALNKDDEDQSKKKKQKFEAKAFASKKRKDSSPKQKSIDEEEKTSATSSTAEIEEILKVMTETLPVKLSPLGLHLMKLFHKEKEPTKTNAPRPKRQRIVTVTKVIEATPPKALAPKVPVIENVTATEAARSEAIDAEATVTEDINLENVSLNIDKILLDMVAEEAAGAIEETSAPEAEKKKEIAEETLEDEIFNFQNLVGQELTKAEKEELKEYAISCGYRPGALLFGGVDDEKLACIRDQTGAKVIGTLSKSIGFPKLEADISRYRRQHIVGSLFYSNFKVNNLLLTFYFYKKCFLTKVIHVQSMLLSKALRMQQDLEDKKHEVIIENLENKIKDQTTAFEKKEFELQTTEGLLSEAEAKITELNTKLLGSEQEKLKLNGKLEAEMQNSLALKKSLIDLQNKCLKFSNQCVQRLKKVFYSVGASSEEFIPSVEDLPGAFEHIEGEIDDLDDVIAGHGDFCALVASRGTAAAFLKSGCGHGKIINRHNFSLSPPILDDIPNLARSIANKFIKVIWTKGGREKAGDEARDHLKLVTILYLMITFSFEF